MSSDAGIVVVGSCNTDLIAYVPRMPALGETITGSAFQSGFGGKGANQCVIAAKLGVKVAMVGAVGDDSFGRETLANFTCLGVDVSKLKVVAGGTTGVAPIWVDAHGHNSIVVVPGTNDLVTAAEADAAVHAATAARTLLCQLEIPVAATVAALRAAKAPGRHVTTFFSPAPAPPVPDALPHELWAAVDVALPNAIEASQVAGPAAQSTRAAIEGRLELTAFSTDSRTPTDEAGGSLAPALSSALALLQRGCKSVVVTLGAAGAVVAWDKDSHDKPSAKPAAAPSAASLHAVLVPGVRVSPERVVDTTGAGDAFAGSAATFYALLAPGGHGSGALDTAALVEAVRRAVFVAAQTVQKKGTQSSYPHRSELPQELFRPRDDAAAASALRELLPEPTVLF